MLATSYTRFSLEPSRSKRVFMTLGVLSLAITGTAILCTQDAYAKKHAGFVTFSILAVGGYLAGLKHALPIIKQTLSANKQLLRKALFILSPLLLGLSIMLGIPSFYEKKRPAFEAAAYLFIFSSLVPTSVFLSSHIATKDTWSLRKKNSVFFGALSLYFLTSVLINELYFNTFFSIPSAAPIIPHSTAFFTTLTPTTTHPITSPIATSTLPFSSSTVPGSTSATSTALPTSTVMPTTALVCDPTITGPSALTYSKPVGTQELSVNYVMNMVLACAKEVALSITGSYFKSFLCQDGVYFFPDKNGIIHIVGEEVIQCFSSGRAQSLFATPKPNTPLGELTLNSETINGQTFSLTTKITTPP